MRVSVVIPSYNHAAYVEQAIRSVLEQDWPDIDLIVIDDGSKDDSPNLISNLLEGKQGCRYVLRENQGVINTLNQGIEMAEGECICLLSSDDYLLPGSLRLRAEHLVRNPECAAVFADGLLVFEAEETNKTITKEKVRRLFEVQNPVLEIMKGVHLPLHTMMVRTQVLRAVGAFDTRYQICEDLDIQVRLFLAGRVDYIDQVVRCYRKHETNVSLSQHHRFCADRVLCMQKYLSEMPQLTPYRPLIRRRLTRYYLALGRYLSHGPKNSGFERSVFESSWKYAWRDLRLLWHFIFFWLGLYGKQDTSSDACF